MNDPPNLVDREEATSVESPPQFGLRGLLIFVKILSVLFGFIRAFGQYGPIAAWCLWVAGLFFMRWKRRERQADLGFWQQSSAADWWLLAAFIFFMGSVAVMVIACQPPITSSNHPRYKQTTAPASTAATASTTGTPEPSAR